MSKLSKGVFVALTWGVLAAGCASEPPAAEPALGSSTPARVDDSVPDDTENRAREPDLPEQQAAAQVRVPVKYVIEPGGAAQSVAPSGLQRAVPDSASTPQMPGAMRRRQP